MKLTFPTIALLGILTFGCAPVSYVVPTPAPPAPAPVAPIVELQPIPVPPPPDPTEKIVNSISRLGGTGLYGGEQPVNWFCTAFSIAPRKYLTAAHCTLPLHQLVNGGIKLDGRPAFVVAEDIANDLAIVVTDYVQPTLTIRAALLHKYDKVQAMGFGYAFTYPIRTDHVVMLLNYSPAEGIAPGTIYLYPFAGGMSGGPVYDGNGDIVGMVQRSNETVAYGVGSDVIQQFLDKN